ncbi:MAG: polymerase sigma-70 factor [Actinomycetia bacterium]|nr:polymerase sigma-70 factor [Actinomycetes bacterium]
MDDPTAQLRARARAGDADAFGAVFDACAKSVYNHAFRLTGDWSTAEEVMAMTFLEAWRGRDSILADGGSLRPWLLGIATNLARGLHRTARRHRTALARLAVADELPDFADDVSGRLDDVARIKALHRALAELPGAELEVLALCVWSGLSYAEAAGALHVPVGTIRSRLSRARARAKLARLTDGELRRPDGGAAHKNFREPMTIPDQLMSRPAIAGLSNQSDISGKSGKEARR